MNQPARSQFVTDTHALLWLLIDSPRLSSAANAAFQLMEAGLAHLWVPTIVLAELIYVSRRHQLPLTLDTVLQSDRVGSVVHVADLDLQVLREFERLERPSEIHNRLIVATARVLEAPLISADQEIRSTGQVEMIW